MAYLSGAGYGDWKYNKEELTVREARALHNIPWLRRVLQFDAVAVHGTSGVWLAPALVSHDIPVVLVRKAGETVHGFRVEGPPGRDVNRVLLLDDFVATGDTVIRVAGLLAHVDYDITLCGVLEHSCPPWATELAEGDSPKRDVNGIPVYGPRD